MNVNGMDVRVVESHEESLGDWADARVAHGSPLMLITLDRHLDTTPALTAEFAESDDDEGDPERQEKHRRRVLSRYGPGDADGIEELVERLANDEQIDAALRLGILDRVLVVSSQQGRSGIATVDGVTVVRPECAPGCAETEHTGEACARRRFDAFLESDVLGPALASFGVLPESAPAYVLDVDLDTFSTRRGLAPSDPIVFHALIRHARMVTLAREPEYVRESLDDHSAEEIEAALVGHIERAMADERADGAGPAASAIVAP